MTKKTKTCVKYMCLGLFLVLVIAASAVLLDRLKEAKMVYDRIIGKEEIKRREAAFKEDPTIHNAMFLMDKYNFLKEYDKALFYGKSCIDLGVNKTPKGVYVNLWMADIYNKINKLPQARNHLRIAITLDKKELIEKYNYIEQLNLQSVFGSLNTSTSSSGN